jgi:hypothetical protein
VCLDTDAVSMEWIGYDTALRIRFPAGLVSSTLHLHQLALHALHSRIEPLLERPQVMREVDSTLVESETPLAAARISAATGALQHVLLQLKDPTGPPPAAEDVDWTVVYSFLTALAMGDELHTPNISTMNTRTKSIILRLANAMVEDSLSMNSDE